MVFLPEQRSSETIPVTGSWIVQPRPWSTLSWTGSRSSAAASARGQRAASSAPHPRRRPAVRWQRCPGVCRPGRCLPSWPPCVGAAPKSTVAGLIAVIFLSAATSLTPYDISSQWTHTAMPCSRVGKFFGV